MAHVSARRNESTENLIKRFTRKVKNAGILEEYRKRMYYEKPSETRRRKEARRKKVLAKLKRMSGRKNG
jgi:small subunit ribosomal protein S21